METVKRISLALIIVGAINWLLIGLFQFDLVAALFGGQDAALSRVVYTLVGIGGVLCLPSLFAPIEGDDYNYNTNYATEFSEDNETFRDKE
ncbi:hypothetical protein GCM10028778_13240 [Barrientosiimonas marina]|uniref:DUF378 domain-containing protein n=1 Tax=Lentibacillus kimchii TaxID=1542911 RepID=A0ABW2UR42_9BACI